LEDREVTLDVTVVCPSAHLYVAAVDREAGSVAELAAARKRKSNLDFNYTVLYT